MHRRHIAFKHRILHRNALHFLPQCGQNLHGVVASAWRQGWAVQKVLVDRLHGINGLLQKQPRANVQTLLQVVGKIV